jgi:hypothetical protein
LQNKLFDDINHLTQGRVESQIINKKEWTEEKKWVNY